MRTIRPTGRFTDQGDHAGMTRTSARKYTHRTLPPEQIGEWDCRTLLCEHAVTPHVLNAVN